ncbi:MAG: four helix bundle protein [Saprospiraceae bacterium]|nr:four helix bundle protein [Saprospiraceae bacterium]
MKRKQTPLSEKTFKMAVRIVKLCRYLAEKKKEMVISKQLLRAGTSPGAMVREADNAESNADFIHKLGVAQKETSEAMYWLELLQETGYLSGPEFESIYPDTEEVMRLLRSSILTQKRKTHPRP